jgi:TonB family protein
VKRLAMALLAVPLIAPPSEGQPPSGAPGTARPVGGWLVTISRSEMTDQPSVTLQLEALNLLPGAIVDVRPAILVRCHEQELDVFITTGAVLHGDTYDMTPVRVRWGTGTPEEASWSRSTDFSAAFAPDPGAFLKQLLGAPDMRFEFRPFDAAPRVASFNARGLDLHISTLEGACPTLWEPLDSGTGIELGGDQIYAEAAVEEKPELLSAPQPEYPQLLRTAGIQGTVVVQVVIDTTGRVEPNSLKIIRSPNPGFDQPVKDAMRRALFRPGRLQGRAVRVLVQIPFNFTLKK